MLDLECRRDMHLDVVILNRQVIGSLFRAAIDHRLTSEPTCRGEYDKIGEGTLVREQIETSHDGIYSC